MIGAQADLLARAALPRESAASRVNTWLERGSAWRWAAIFLCAVAPALLCAYWKPLNHDELFTYEIARQPGFADVWRALRAGADFHPPLDFLLRHLSMRLFGESEVAFRLPSIIAIWIALGCLYSFVARRTSALYGLIAALIPLSTPVFEYAYEGRAYAWMVAFAALALVPCQRSTEGSRTAPVVLAGSLAALVWSHYYGVLAFVAIGAGELVRTWDRRKVDWRIWGALSAGVIGLLSLWPFIRAARQLGAAYWSKVGIIQAVSMYSTFLERLSPAAVAAIAILLVTGWSSRLRGGQRRARRHEIAAVAGFVLLPVIAYLLAKTATGAVVPRYVLLTVTGLAIGIAFAGWEALGGFVPAGFVVAAALAVSAAGGEAAFAYKQRQLRAELTRDNLPAIVHDLPGPIVVTDNDLLMPLWHYEPAAVAERLVFLSDETAAV